MTIASDLAVLKERVDSFIRYATGAFAVSWVAIGFLVFYYVPTLIDSKIAQANQPIQATQALILENTPALLPAYLKTAKDPVENKLRVVTSALQNAKAQKIVLNVSKIVQVNDELKSLPQEEAWPARLELATYRTFVNAEIEPRKPTTGSTPCLQNPRANVELRRNTFRNCTQVLTGGFWEDNVFENVTFVYTGAPLIFRHNQLLECKFQVLNNPNGQKFIDAVIASPEQGVVLTQQ